MNNKQQSILSRRPQRRRSAELKLGANKINLSAPGESAAPWPAIGEPSSPTGCGRLAGISLLAVALAALLGNSAAAKEKQPVFEEIPGLTTPSRPTFAQAAAPPTNPTP